MAPPWSDVIRCSDATKEYWNQWELLELKDGVLYRRWVAGDGHPRWFQLIPPVAMRQELIRHAHTGYTGGHLGVRKTQNQVQRRAFWKGWIADVYRFCRRCPECCSYRRGGPPRQSALQDLTVGAPWERIGIDLTGRHPRSRRGNYYILTYVDHFTKFAEALPIPNKEAATVCTVLVEQVFPPFGTPIQILSDRGKEFDNTLMRGLCEGLGIDKMRTTPYKASTTTNQPAEPVSVTTLFPTPAPGQSASSVPHVRS